MSVTINGSTGISGVDGSASTPAYQGGDSNTGVFFPAADTIAFAEGGAEVARFDDSGRLLVGVTSATANGGVLELSGGITFPATAVAATDANTLDDYEEGTFSPTVFGSSTAGTATYATQSGRYTKIGRTVLFEAYINWSSGTGTGELRFGGLPFTSAAVETYPSVTIGMVDSVSIAASTFITLYVAGNSTTIITQTATVGGGANGNVNYDAAGRIMLSGHYTVP